MISKMLSFRLDFIGKKCGDINRVNRNVIVDETAIVFFELIYQCDLWLMVVCLRVTERKKIIATSNLNSLCPSLIMDGHRKLERKAKLGLSDYCHASTRQINHEPVLSRVYRSGNK